MSCSAEDVIDSGPPLEDILECPICLQVPVAKPFYQCSNGHLLCKSCYPEVMHCPVCLGILSHQNPLRNLTAEKLFDSCTEYLVIVINRTLAATSKNVTLELFSCAYVLEGCNEVCTTKVRIGEHEKNCKYRLVFCPHHNCSKNRKKVSLSKLFCHIDADHSTNRCFTKMMPGYTRHLTYPSGYTNKKTFNFVAFLVQFDGLQFFEKICVKEGQWHFWIYIVGSPEEASKYKAEYKLFNTQGEVKMYVNGCALLTLDVNADDLWMYDTMSVKNSVIMKCTKDDKVTYSVEIKRCH